MVLWHGRSCEELCGAVLWYSQQDDSNTQQSIFSMYRWPSFWRGSNETCGRIVQSMLSNCSEMIIFDTNWKTWYSPVSEQTCTINHKMDQSMWQNAWIVWYHTFITHVNTNSIAMWVVLLNNADWDFFKAPILQEILRIQNLLLEEHWAYSAVIHSIQSVGCARNKLQFHTVQQNPKSSLWMRDWGWLVSPLSICGILLFKYLASQLTTIIQQGETRCLPSHDSLSKSDQWFG